MTRPAATDSGAGGPVYLTTAQVAEALGVGVSTVKRWVDEGVLTAHRTPGGHRKLLASEVARAAREGNLPRAEFGRLASRKAGTPDPAALARQVRDAALGFDAELVRGLIRGAHRDGLPVPAITDELVAPVLRHVGAEWEAGRLDVADEHRISQSFVSALYELEATFRQAGAGRPVALGGAPEGDFTLLPTLAAKLTLLEAGWDSVNLGPHTPFSAFRRAVESLRPRFVWLCVTHPVDWDRFVAEYGAFYQEMEVRGVPVVVGGRALTEDVRRRITFSSHGDGMAHLAAFARTLHRRPDRPRRGRPRG